MTTGSTNRSKGDKDSLLANIAMLYYGEGLTQSEISKRMQVSRATIVNLLRESRDKGIVEIRIDGKHLSSSNLARELRQRFTLSDAYVALSNDTVGLSRRDLLAHVARVAAAAVLDVMEPGDRIGIAWGETIMALSDALQRTPVPDVEVCQLIGAMKSTRVPASEMCAIQIANKLGAVCYTLHAPGIVATPELAAIFRDEPTIKAQLARLHNLDMTIASIGNVADETHLAAAGMATLAELGDARAAGAVGIICCRYIDAAGRPVAVEPDRRVIAPELETLKEARKRFLVVCGTDRLHATLAAINGGFVSHLCVDQALAEALLKNPR